LCTPATTYAQSYEALFEHNRTIVQVQQETDNAVRWISTHGYNDDVAYQFVRRCGWLRITPGGNEWCEASSAHRDLMKQIWNYGSSSSIHLLKEYRTLSQR
jgi:hypothetical protein